DFHGKALQLRSERQRTIASNIANGDTPGYQARDFDFKAAMQDALGQADGKLAQPSSLNISGTTGGAYAPSNTPAIAGATDARHIPLPRNTGQGGLGENGMGYRDQIQPAMDNNSVDMDRERSNFVDNSIRYESTLRFINGYSKTIRVPSRVSDGNHLLLTLNDKEDS
ncbi:flagellar basal body rod protein FlgB, partial [Leptospira sp. 96542]|nr:flagellar basal body rod protein FlgB [Leptospira sp. 96542]